LKGYSSNIFWSSGKARSASSGSNLVVTELSRMARSLLDLLETAKTLQQRRIEPVSLREGIA